jgi:hypothetical protein
MVKGYEFAKTSSCPWSRSTQCISMVPAIWLLIKAASKPYSLLATALTKLKQCALDVGFPAAKSWAVTKGPSVDPPVGNAAGAKCIVSRRYKTPN